MSMTGLARNAGALYIVQLANYVVPLLLLPFLTRVLGARGYGELAALQAVAAYGVVLTDYGFQLSATRKIAAMLERGEAVAGLYLHVTAARFLLAILAILLMGLAVAALPFLHLTWSVALALALLVLGNALTPLWLFQGFQRMVLVSLTVLMSRLLSVLLTVSLVHTPGDVGVALWAQALGVALPTGFALWRAALLVPARGRLSLAGIHAELKDGWYIFQTAIFGSLLTNSGVLILGTVAGAHVAGGYAAVERIGKGVSIMLTPITQSLYPQMSASFARSHAQGLGLLRRFGPPLLLLSGLMALLLLLISKSRGIGWLFGREYQEYAGVLAILAPWMIAGVLNNLMGIQYLTNVGQQAWYAAAFTISSVTAVILFVGLSSVFSYWGIAWGLVTGEVLLSVLLYWKVRTLNSFGRVKEVKL